MQGKSVAVYTAILVIGFALGWTVKPEQEHLQTPQSTEPENVALAEIAPPKTVMSKPAPETGVENQSQPQLSEIDAASAQLQQLLEARQRELEVSIDDWDVADLLDFLQSAGEEEFYSAYELFSMFAVKPELASTFLDNYLSITDPKTKNRAKQLLTASYPGQNNIIEEKIIDRMRQGDPPDEWLDVLSDVGVFTNDSLTYLGEQLGYFAEAQQVSKAIRAINKGSDAFFNKIPRQTRETLTSQVNNHLRSTDPEVKGAALRALAAFPVENSEAILIEALSDSNTLVQRSAIASLMRGKFQDASVSDALLNLMRDENNAFDTRMLATRALRRYNLTGQDYDDLYDFSLEIRNHQQNQLRQQRQANQQLQ